MTDHSATVTALAVGNLLHCTNFVLPCGILTIV